MSDDTITVTLDRKTAWLVRQSIAMHRDILDHILVDLPYATEDRSDLIHRLTSAKLAFERAATS